MGMSVKDYENQTGRFRIVKNDDEYRWDLVDTKTSRVVGSDGGEPEDQLLVRDWQWVPQLLNELAADNARLTAENARLREALIEVEAQLRVTQAPCVYADVLRDALKGGG